MNRGAYIRPHFVLTNGDGKNVYSRDRGGLKIGGRIDFCLWSFRNMGQFRQIDVMREQVSKACCWYSLVKNGWVVEEEDIVVDSFIKMQMIKNHYLITKYGVDFYLSTKDFSALGRYYKSMLSSKDITQRIRNSGSISWDFTPVEDGRRFEWYD